MPIYKLKNNNDYEKDDDGSRTLPNECNDFRR